MNKHTPKFFTKLLSWFCHDDFYEELQGDLEESFIKNTNTRGLRKARAIYRKEVLKMVRGSVVRPRISIPQRLRFSLFRMHFVLSLRSIRRNMAFTLLNVVGFGAAISVCLFLANTILTAYNLDKSFSNKENKYRISTIINTEGDTNFSCYSPATLFSHLPTILPEAKGIAGFKTNSFRLNFRGRDIIVEGIEASAEFLNMLDYKVLAGSIETVINDPLHIAVTEDFVKKYSLGDEVIGKQLGKYIVSAVLESTTLKSHLDFEWLNFSEKLDYVAPVEYSYDYYFDRSRTNYIEVYDEADLEDIKEKLNAFAVQLNDTLINKSYKFQLENLSDLGLSRASLKQANLLTGEGVNVMLIFMLIMTLIASINYTNLASAKAMHRLKEIGVRKVVGSKRIQVFNQFILETCLLGFLGLALGFLLYFWFARDIKDLIPFAFDSHVSIDTAITFIATSIIVSLLAGIVPGLFLSRISPLNLFRSKSPGKTFGFQRVRKVLLVIQLTITAFVFVFGSLFWKQYNSYQKEDIGMELGDIYFLEFDYPDSTQSLLVFKNEMDKLSQVEASSFMSQLVPIDDTNGLMMIKTENSNDSLMTSITWADSSFFHTYKPKMELVDESIMRNNRSSMFVNKSFLMQLNIPLEAALGTNIRTGNEIRPIAGVFEQAISSNYNPIVSPGKQNGTNFSEALVVIPNLIQNLLVVRVAPNSNAIPKIEQVFLKLFPDENIVFRSLEDLSKSRYPELKKAVKIFTYVFICIILITLMGQMGIAIFNAETKTKEIGIRKVLGASVTKLSLNLIKGTLIQISIALLIAVPIATLLFKDAMGSYRDPIRLSPQLYASILILFTAIILATVMSLIVPKAKANPVESLRNE